MPLIGTVNNALITGSAGHSLLPISGTLAIRRGGDGAGAMRLYEDADNGDLYSGFTVGNMAANVVYTLPTNDGSNGQQLTTNGSGVLSWAAAGSTSLAADDIAAGDGAVSIETTSGNITIDAQANDADVIIKVDDNGSSVTAVTFDGSDEGNAVFVNDLKLSSDSSAIHWGANNEVTLTHEHNVGLILTHTASGDDQPVKLTLKSEEDAIVADEVIGAIDFKGGDSDGTDAVLVCAGIEAVATDTHAADNNATKLSFKTAASEAAAEKMSLSSAGLLTVSGRIITDDTTEATSTTDGSLQTDGGLSVAKDCVFGDDVFLLSDSAVLNMGADNDVTFTHDGTTGLTIAGNPITIDSGADIVLDADGADVIFKDGGTTILTFTNSSSDAVLTSGVQDKDIIFKGDDGGSAVTALTLDMSDAGTAIFNHDILPENNGSQHLGSATKRWANIYTSDLVLNNDRGNWTLIEEADYLTFRNNNTGRRFRMLMEDITDSGDYGPDIDGNM